MRESNGAKDLDRIAPTMPPTTNSDPQSEYRKRLKHFEDIAARASNADNLIAMFRGIIFLSGVGLAYVVLAYAFLSPLAIAVPAVVFLLLMLLHERIADRLKHAGDAVDYYQTAIARLDDNWAGHAASGDRYMNPNHPYTGDLDVFGHGSLFQLISCARTRLGEDTLANWFSEPADVETIRERQAAVAELRENVDLREQLALLDADVHDELDQNQLDLWALEPPRLVSRTRRRIAAGLAVLSVIAVVGWTAFDIGPSPLVVVLIVESILMFTLRKQIRAIARKVDSAGSGLVILSLVLDLLEREQFSAPLLVRIHDRFNTEGHPPSKQIKRLQRLIDNLDNSLKNQFFAPIAFALCLPIHIANAIERWRTSVGPSIPDWLDSVGELEALLSLAGYAYEHPEDPFPEIVEAEPLLNANDIGHPLLPRSQCVRNDLSLGGELRLLLVSGSNMSGKSTLLRTVGTNCVLALSGAPVCAKALRISPIQIGTAMRINDSLQDGKSLFYAVVARLKSVVELNDAGLPLLFLLDEILQGTNSHDRRVGAEGVIRRLVEDGATGLVTTHDLALTEIVDSFGSRAINVHFEDRIDKGKMTFDYRIQPGVIKRSNALELMRMMGLDV